MKHIMTLIWTILLMLMLTYVVSAMVGVPFDLQIALVLGIASTILIYVVPTILPKQEEDGQHQ